MLAQKSKALSRFVEAARAAAAINLGVNAGHDLNRENLTEFLLAAVLHDFAYLTLLGADQSIVLSREERNAATARLPAILARWSRGCREGDQAGRIRCAIGKIAAKKRIERYFISHEQGGKCTVRESLDGKKEISNSQCVRE